MSGAPRSMRDRKPVNYKDPTVKEQEAAAEAMREPVKQKTKSMKSLIEFTRQPSGGTGAPASNKGKEAKLTESKRSVFEQQLGVQRGCRAKGCRFRSISGHPALSPAHLCTNELFGHAAPQTACNAKASTIERFDVFRPLNCVQAEPLEHGRMSEHYSSHNNFHRGLRSHFWLPIAIRACVNRARKPF